MDKIILEIQLCAHALEVKFLVRNKASPIICQNFLKKKGESEGRTALHGD
jgi:hypothetical protein